MERTDNPQLPPEVADEDVSLKTFEFVFKGAAPERKRMDVYLASRISDFSRTFFKKLIEHGAVTVNGAVVKPSYQVKPGDRIVARIPTMLTEPVEPEDIPLDILYEDDWLIAINKPPDMVVHPAKGHQTGTLVNAAAFHCNKLSSRSGELRAGVVHRLDRDTSGVILMVKDEMAHQEIAWQFENRRVEKEYVAICEGRLELDNDVIDAPIGPHVRLPERMSVRYDVGREARTVYQVAERLGPFSIVKCFPKTGRTHQIRVHLMHIRHPILCDSVYGRRDAVYLSDLTGTERTPNERPLIARQALHARRLTIYHPVLKRSMCFEAPIPGDMMALIGALRAYGA
jgi:23S rRNA pseudouridine1911/1915/1917 synthase